jgi:flagellar motor switch protein FliG
MKYFTYLENIEAEQLFEVIHKEHPQTIAIILVYIDADVAADILSMFTDDIKADIAIRMSQFNSVPDALIKSISDTLINKITPKGIKLGGVKVVANILKHLK